MRVIAHVELSHIVPVCSYATLWKTAEECVREKERGWEEREGGKRETEGVHHSPSCMSPPFNIMSERMTNKRPVSAFSSSELHHVTLCEVM